MTDLQLEITFDRATQSWRLYLARGGARIFWSAYGKEADIRENAQNLGQLLKVKVVELKTISIKERGSGA